MMSRSDFVAVARVLSKYHKELPCGLTTDMADALTKRNKLFNREKFLKAIYLTLTDTVHVCVDLVTSPPRTSNNMSRG